MRLNFSLKLVLETTLRNEYYKIRFACTMEVSLGSFTETKTNLMKRFIGTYTASIELFFNITFGIETFVIP